LGIIGVALSFCLSLGARDVFFTSIYTAIITGQTKRKFITKTLPGVSMAFLVGFGAFGLSRIFHLANVSRLLMAVTFLSVVYAGFCYIVMLDRKERAVLSSLITRKNTALPAKNDEFRNILD
jgi:hypothetical protein